MSGIEIEWEPIAKWGAIGGVAALGVYLAYRYITSGAEAEKKAKKERYQSVCGIVADTVNRYEANEITKEQYNTIIEDNIKEANRLEKKMHEEGIPESFIRKVLMAIFGVPVATLTTALGIYLMKRSLERSRKPPLAPPEEPESLPKHKISTAEFQKKIADLLKTDVGWVKSNWKAIFAVIVGVLVLYGVTQVAGGWAVPDEPVWGPAAAVAIRGVVGVPPVA